MTAFCPLRADLRAFCVLLAWRIWLDNRIAIYTAEESGKGAHDHVVPEDAGCAAWRDPVWAATEVIAMWVEDVFTAGPRAASVAIK